MSIFPSLHDALISALGNRLQDRLDFDIGFDRLGRDDDGDIDRPRNDGRGRPHDLPDGDDLRPRRPDGDDLQPRRPDGHVRGPRADDANPLRPGDPLPPRTHDAPTLHTSSQPGREALMETLTRELRQLPNDVVRQLTQALVSDSAALRAQPASAEALAALVARAVSDAAQPRSGNPLATTDPNAHSARLLAAQQPTMPTRAEAALAMAQLLAMRGDAVPAAHGHPAASAATDGADVAALTPQQSLPARAPNEALPLQARVEGHVVADRANASSGLSGNVSAVAAGVTVATMATPAGTTYAIAPQTPARLRESANSQDDDAVDRDHDGNAQGDAEADAGNAGTTTDAEAGAGTKEAAPSESRAAGHTVATTDRIAPKLRRSSGAGGWLASLFAAAATQAQPQGHVHSATAPVVDPERQRSRRLRWLYWLLTAVAYACVAVTLALVAPGFLAGDAPTPDKAGLQQALIVIGLGTALGAWLLARRLR